MSLINGIKNCEAIADLLNNIILTTDAAIEIDNKKIWSGFLHLKRVDNEYWADTIQAMEMLLRETPNNFKVFNRSALGQAKVTLASSQALHPRCMDTKENKTKAWSLIMTIREVINSINQVSIPNR